MTQAPTLELDYRETDGIQVRLLWWPAADRITVEVVDEPRGDSFALVVPKHLALDAFHHPFAYAARDASVTDYLEQARAA